MAGFIHIGLTIRRASIAVILIFSFGFLSACDSSEDRAEKFYQSALALLEKGDEDRAIIEFRNVFKLNGRHRAARTDFANLQRERGNVRGAVGQYLRLVEQYPDDVEGNRALAELYAELGNWAEMERYLNAILRLAPDEPVGRALQIVFDYRNAIEDRDGEAAGHAATAAAEMQETLPDYILLWQVVIDNNIRKSEYNKALKGLDRAIEISPDDRRLYAVRLSVLGALGDAFAIEAQLKNMIERFPDDDASRITLVRWYVSQEQLDEAESFLRAAIDPQSGNTDARMTLLQFLTELRGNEVALDELNAMIGAGVTSPIFSSLKASLEFELGNIDQAIEEMESLIDGLEPSDETRKIKISLAKMLTETSNPVGARALIEEVLVEDPGEVTALKLKAGWLVEDDETGPAIVALRAAMDRSPRDPEIMTLMAIAHEREGDQELVGEMLSLAVEASNKAPEESVRYARYLESLGKYGTVESVLVAALRLAPADFEILLELGTFYTIQEDWARTQQVINTLRRFETVESDDLANALTAQMLQAQDNTAEAVSFLEGLVESGDAGFEANVAIVGTLLDNGEFEKARSHVNEMLTEEPDDLGVQFMDAAVDAAAGNAAAAETKYRSILAQDSGEARVWVALFRLLLAEGRSAAAADVIDEAEAALPIDPTIKWIKAGLLENAGDLAGAIAIYEKLYIRDSSNLIVANNLASLISATSEDPADIERAYIIARRLRSSPVPPYQDTFGWIAFLRGDVDEAIKTLEPAAIALADDPTVQYHLARAYVAAEREGDAVIQFRKVVALTSAADTSEYVEESRAEIVRLLANPEKAETE